MCDSCLPATGKTGLSRRKLLAAGAGLALASAFQRPSGRNRPRSVPMKL
ncbi:hypothetical protein [Bosea vestrisii]